MQNLEASLRALRRDTRFAPLIKKYGPPHFHRYHGKISVFESLLRSIIYQQLSGKAAAAIHKRVLELFPRRRPTPALLLKADARKLRACGLSVMKIRYLKDLARRFANGSVGYRRFAKMTSEEITEHLVEIDGVGTWTAQMVLIFTLGRPDVLPTGDLAIRKGFQKLYGLKGMPSHKDMEGFARAWREHASVASWYLWRVMDDQK